MFTKRVNILSVVIVATLAFGLTACGSDKDSSSSSSGGDLSGDVSVDGSSTVYPLTEAAAETFQGENSGVQVTVSESGTGGGFEKFCKGETDMNDASRPIKPEEIAACKKAGITYKEIQVANDGIAVVVNKDNSAVECLTTDQLKLIWDKGSKVKNWKDVDPKFPDKEIELFGPGTDSGTFDYYTESINGEEGRSRSDYTASEDDNVLVEGVSGSEGGLGYFGLSYYEQNKDKLKLVKVDAGDGCVEPSTETVQSGEYKPLARPLFIYPSEKALARPEAKAFVKYYVENASEIAAQALLVPLSEDQQSKSDQAVASL